MSSLEPGRKVASKKGTRAEPLESLDPNSTQGSYSGSVEERIQSFLRSRGVPPSPSPGSSPPVPAQPSPLTQLTDSAGAETSSVHLPARETFMAAPEGKQENSRPAPAQRISKPQSLRDEAEPPAPLKPLRERLAEMGLSDAAEIQRIAKKFELPPGRAANPASAGAVAPSTNFKARATAPSEAAAGRESSVQAAPPPHRSKVVVSQTPRVSKAKLESQPQSRLLHSEPAPDRRSLRGSFAATAAAAAPLRENPAEADQSIAAAAKRWLLEQKVRVCDAQPLALEILRQFRAMPQEELRGWVVLDPDRINISRAFSLVTPLLVYQKETSLKSVRPLAKSLVTLLFAQIEAAPTGS